MITTKDLESLGWVNKATATNGGSKLFTKGEYFTIWSNADNFIMERRKSTEFEEITINKIQAKNTKEGLEKKMQTILFEMVSILYT